MNTTAKPEEKNFDTMQKLNNYVLHLEEYERRNKKTAKEISNALQYFVDQENKDATGYRDNFRSRIEEKEDQADEQIWKKYFGSQTKLKIFIQSLQDIQSLQNIEIRNKIDEYKKASIKWKLKKKVYEAIKRLFNKEITSHGGNDIDKDAGLFLLKLAGFFKNRKGETREYEKKSVSYGESGEQGFQYDSGGTENGLKIIPNKQIHQQGKHKGEEYVSLFNALVIADEHDDKSEGAKNEKKPTSSTHIIFDLLDELQTLSPTYKKQIKRFVDFVDKVDSQYYQFVGADKQVSHKTLFGLHENIAIRKIYEYFENPENTGFEVLSEAELESLDIKNGYEQQQQTNERREKEFNELKAKGRLGNFNNEKFVFARGEELGGGQKVSAAVGDIGVFKIQEDGDLYMYSPKILPQEICGIATNKNFLNVKKISLEDLEKILEVFEFGNESEGGIKESFLKYRKEQIKKEYDKIEQKKRSEESLEKNISTLESVTESSHFIKGRMYTGVINNIINRVAFVSLNQENTYRGRIRVTDKAELQGYAIGSLVQVKIDEITEEAGKLLISLSFAPDKEE